MLTIVFIDTEVGFLKRITAYYSFLLGSDRCKTTVINILIAIFKSEKIGSKSVQAKINWALIRSMQISLGLRTENNNWVLGRIKHFGA